jgi:hypothetical protein
MKPRHAEPRASAPPAEGLELAPGQSRELLQELHILTRDGRINQDSRRKLKQVRHLYQFIEKLLLELPDSPQGITLADHGAGKRRGRGPAMFTGSNPAPNWSSARASWRPGSASPR